MGRMVICVIGAFLAAAGSAPACNVPVFRFSLERWRPDRYDMVVIQRGPLTVDEQKLIDALPKDDKCNLTVSTIDWNKIAIEDQEKLQAVYQIPQFPWVIVRYPTHVAADGPAYAGPLTAEAMRNLLDSPVRTRLSQQLLRGESAVWLLLESGDAKKDNDVEARLKTWLGKLESTLKLPELTNSPKDKLLREDLPLKMSFSILRVSRADAAEKQLVHILSHMEKDLGTVGEPIVIPVFGRGLALYAIVGKGITEGNVNEAAKFMTGACSCEVKQLNPGVDLLMTTDWEDARAPAPAQSRTSSDPVTLVPVKLPQPNARQATSRPSSAEELPSTTQPEVASAEPADGFLRLDNPVLSVGVCGLLGALAVGYYGAMRFGPKRRSPARKSDSSISNLSVLDRDP